MVGIMGNVARSSCRTADCLPRSTCPKLYIPVRRCSVHTHSRVAARSFSPVPGLLRAFETSVVLLRGCEDVVIYLDSRESTQAQCLIQQRLEDLQDTNNSNIFVLQQFIEPIARRLCKQVRTARRHPLPFIVHAEAAPFVFSYAL